ncbi:hypothetical protein PR202_ga22079 [Eleusine coracana subsp. coracana]|uniref:Uncharacterized protein n=1 Tax=Eleusine coracana subsp. coracana TaxID=191504 RepID=A0AAV5D340_ELECO|nr:hypothetical protein PR202_ga22079 [Eleusine coracana subsp. coracana]
MVYQQVRVEVLSLVVLSPSSSDHIEMYLCLNLSSASTRSAVSDMTFHFDGGADMVLLADSYMFLYEFRLWCLSMMNATTIDGSVLRNY